MIFFYKKKSHDPNFLYFLKTKKIVLRETQKLKKKILYRLSDK